MKKPTAKKHGRNHRSLSEISADIFKLERASIFTIGKLFIEAKEQCEHGAWGRFLRSIDWSQRTAQWYMSVARLTVKYATVADLEAAPTALYCLVDLDERQEATKEACKEAGVTGCVDTIAVLAKTGKGTTLYIRGRDVEEQEKAITFNKETCRWTIMGEAEEVHRSDTRRAILTLLNDVSLVSEPLGPKDIALQTYVPENRVNQRLIGMRKDGEIIKLSQPTDGEGAS